MTLRFNLDMDDLMAFYGYHLKSNKAFRKRLVMWRFLIPALWVLMILIDIARGERIDVVPVAVLSALSILWVIFVPMLIVRLTMKSARRTYAKPENASFMGPQEMTLTEEGFRTQDDGSSSFVQWGKVNKVCRTPQYVFIYMSSMSAGIIPLKQIDPAQAEELDRLLKRHNL